MTGASAALTPEPYWASDAGDVIVHLGDCRDVLRGLPSASIDAVVTDPPYDLTAGKKGGTGPASVNLASPHGRARISTGNSRGGFMGKDWDATGVAFDPATWAEVLRVLKPGGHLLAFGGTRTWHRMVCAIEDAGFEIRDGIPDLAGLDAPALIWLYGSGFPKSLDVERTVATGTCAGPGRHFARSLPEEDKRLPDDHVCPVTPESEPWAGWGTALKPAWEPIVLARKPLAGTVAQNVLEYGTGALNIDGCRVGDDTSRGERYNGKAPGGSHGDGLTGGPRAEPWDAPAGRWPPNVVLGPAAAAELDRQSGRLTSGVPGVIGESAAERAGNRSAAYGKESRQAGYQNVGYGDTGGASRFYPVFRYEAKAPSAERPRLADGSSHETVKPMGLIRWLCRLICPPDGTILDLFAGTGPVGVAAVIEGFRTILIDQDPKSAALMMARFAKPVQPLLFTEGDT